MPANPWCPSRQRERLPAGNADDPPCSWHHQSDGGLLVFWPSKYRQWAKQNGLLKETRAAAVVTAASSSPPAHAAATPAAGAPLAIVNPPAGGVYLIDPTLRREFQTLAFRAVAAHPTMIDWQVNGRSVGTSSSDSPLMWPLAPGTHRITARDDRGNIAEGSVTVK
jgi:hypothetical protein